jgi:hypothetical protein
LEIPKQKNVEVTRAKHERGGHAPLLALPHTPLKSPCICAGWGWCGANCVGYAGIPDSSQRITQQFDANHGTVVWVVSPKSSRGLLRGRSCPTMGWSSTTRGRSSTTWRLIKRLKANQAKVSHYIKKIKIKKGGIFGRFKTV